MIIAIGITFLVGLIVILVIRSLFPGSHNTPSSHNPHHENFMHPGIYLSHPSDAETKGQDGGDWGGRDMSHDHHHHGGSGDSGGGGDWGGGDTGGGGE